jgi:hypothetical protein
MDRRAAVLVCLVVTLLLAGQAPLAAQPPAPAPEVMAMPVLTAEGPAPAGPGRVWAEAEYLLWWARGSRLPPLITTGPPGTPLEQAGVLGAPGTLVLAGDDRICGDDRSGGRFTLGAWLDPDNVLGVEGHFLILENLAEDTLAASSGTPILSRPFLDATTGLPAAQLVAFPGLLAGSAQVAASCDGLLGAGALLRWNVYRAGEARIDLLAGYRFLRLQDGLQITESLTTTDPADPGGIPLGTTFDLFDRFDTRNEFHGGDLGLAAEFPVGVLRVRLLGKVALGATHQTADVFGATAVAAPGSPPSSNVGGLLALPSNIGHYSRNEFAVVPEFGVKVGGYLTPRLRAWAGYTFLYWSEVARAGDQVSLNVNPALLPPVTGAVSGPFEPAFTFRDTGFWAHGLSLGLEFRF